MTNIYPEHDDLERCNCKKTGEFGHFTCGICENCNKPRFFCGHLNRTALDKLEKSRLNKSSPKK